MPLDATTGLPTAVNSDGLPVGPYPRVAGVVNAAVPDGLGGWYIGGSFTSVGGVARANIAHIRADNSVDTWGPNPNNSVNCLAMNGSSLVVGGVFSTIGGQPRSGIAAVDRTTGLATAWNPNANGRVGAIALNGSTVYAGGLFTAIGGQTRRFLAALDAGTGSATAWDPNPGSEVNAIAIDGPTIYVAGSFTTVGGQARHRIAALDVATGSPTAWDPNANNSVNTLAVRGTQIYAGGLFTMIGGVFADRRDRRHMMLTSQIVQMLVALALAVLIYTGRIQIAHVLTFSFIAGCPQDLRAGLQTNGHGPSRDRSGRLPEDDHGRVFRRFAERTRHCATLRRFDVDPRLSQLRTG